MQPSCHLSLLPLSHSAHVLFTLPAFLVPGTSFVEDNFSMDQGGGGWFQDDSSASHLLCTLFLLLVHCDNVVMKAMGSSYKYNEALLAHPPLTSSCVAWFLTDH